MKHNTSRLLALLCSVLTLASLFTGILPTPVKAAQSSDQILEYEGQNPAASITLQEGESIPEGALPGKGRVTLALAPDQDLSDFIEKTPADLPEGYELVGAAGSFSSVYQVPLTSGAIGRRVYGNYGNDGSGDQWYALNLQDGTIDGIVREAGIDWQIPDLSKAGSYTAASSASGYRQGANPWTAQITVNPKPEEPADLDNSKTSGESASKDDSKETADSTDINADTETDTDASDNSVTTMNNHSLKWLHGSGSSSVENTLIHANPDSDGTNEANVTAQLDFSFGGSDPAPAGTISITLPLHVFKDRKGNWCDVPDVPLIEAPDSTGKNGFNYTVDEENNTMTITNFRAIEPATFLSVQIAWKYHPYDVKSGYSNPDIQADFSLSIPGQPALEEKSDVLSLDYTSHVDAPKPEKFAQYVFREWQDDWGEKPAGEEDKVYVLWELNTITTPGTQPYGLYLSEDPSLNGQMIGWYNVVDDKDESGSDDKDNKDSKGYTFTRADMDEFESRIWKDRHVFDNYSENGLTTAYIVLSYDKADILANKNKVPNTFTAIAKGVDGDEKQVSASAEYTYSEVVFVYGGDKVVVHQKAEGIVHGALNMILGDRPVSPSSDIGSGFAIDVSASGYEAGKKGAKPWTLVLDDNQLYLDNTRLQPGDYEYTSIRPVSFNEYNLDLDPNQGMAPALEKDYSRYSGIDVYVQHEGGDWTKIGTVTKTGEDQYAWNGTPLGKDDVIDLPAGSTGVSMRHTSTNFQTDYKFDVGYRLLPSEHMKSMVKDQYYKAVHNVTSGYLKDRRERSAPSLRNRVKWTRI